MALLCSLGYFGVGTNVACDLNSKKIDSFDLTYRHKRSSRVRVRRGVCLSPVAFSLVWSCDRPQGACAPKHGVCLVFASRPFARDRVHSDALVRGVVFLSVIHYLQQVSGAWPSLAVNSAFLKANFMFRKVNLRGLFDFTPLKHI